MILFQSNIVSTFFGVFVLAGRPSLGMDDSKFPAKTSPISDIEEQIARETLMSIVDSDSMDVQARTLAQKMIQDSKDESRNSTALQFLKEMLEPSPNNSRILEAAQFVKKMLGSPPADENDQIVLGLLDHMVMSALAKKDDLNVLDFLTEVTEPRTRPDCKKSIVNWNEFITLDKKWFETCKSLIQDPCTFTDTCVPLCCPEGESLIEGRCERGNVTSESFTESLPKSEGPVALTEGLNHRKFWNDPCDTFWKEETILTEYTVWPSGSLSPVGETYLYEIDEYCLFRKTGSENYRAKVCVKFDNSEDPWHVAGLAIASFFMLASLIGYTIVPDLRNLQGNVFRSYALTYVTTNLVNFAYNLTPRFLIFYNDLFKDYGDLSMHLWLNVMSFTIWRSFGRVRAVERNNKEGDRKKYVRYAIYAWITPAVLLGGCVTAEYSLSAISYDRPTEIRKWSNWAFISVAMICNISLCTTTVLTIWKHKKCMANLHKDGDNRLTEKKPWLNLYVKLFIIMTSATTIRVVLGFFLMILMGHNVFYISVILQMVQAIFIFIVLLCKDNVKKSVSERFEKLCDRMAVSKFFVKKKPEDIPI